MRAGLSAAFPAGIIPDKSESACIGGGCTCLAAVGAAITCHAIQCHYPSMLLSGIIVKTACWPCGPHRSRRPSSNNPRIAESQGVAPPTPYPMGSADSPPAGHRALPTSWSGGCHAPVSRILSPPAGAGLDGHFSSRSRGTRCRGRNRMRLIPGVIPDRRSGPEPGRRPVSPVLSCSARGLPCLPGCPWER